METEKISGLRGPVFASATLAFASFGDAFLYPFLPVNSAVVGVPVAWVGVLLSINRFVRIFSNAFMVILFTRYGLRIIMISAVAVAIFSTTGYAFASSVFAWTLFRICWGLSFSAMRIGTLGYALQSPRQGLAFGISRAIHETGPMIALFFAPLLLKLSDSRTIFLLISIFSLPGIYFAWNLPGGDDRPVPSAGVKSLQFPSTLNLITFMAAVLIDGIMVVVLGILFLRYTDNISLISATAMAASYLGYRRVCLVILSPGGGWLGERFGPESVYIGSMALVIAGLFVLVSGYLVAGCLMIFTAYSLNAAITPGTVSIRMHHPLSAVSENATWRDVGAALGTLIGGFLISSPFLTDILLIATFALMTLLLIYMGTARRALNLLHLWK